MKPIGPTKRALVWLAVVGFCIPQMALAGTVLPETNGVVVDVALTVQGTFLGQAVNSQGTPMGEISVVVYAPNGSRIATKTDRQGYFSVENLPGGVFQVVVADGCWSYRLWAPGTAPPGAQSQALLVMPETMARGQNCCNNSFLCCLTNPWVVAGVVAAAVAVPVAIYNGDRDSPVSP